MDSVEELIAQALATNATRLDLSYTDLTSLPESIGQLTQLQILDLSVTQITSLPESIEQLTQLQSLNLTATKITSLPESIEQLAQLQSLNLSGTNLTSIPKSIGQLTQLKELYLTVTKITSLPESIEQLTQLQILNVSGTKITSLPESIGQLAQLQSLNLSGTNLTSIPKSIGQLTQLKELNLTSTKITSLPESIEQLAQLQSLYLSSNRITSLPESIEQLAQLQILYLTNIQITSLPESIRQLTQLQSLNLSGTKITSLPESIGRLTQLKELKLSCTQITNLPESIGQLTQLQELNLSYTQITSLPESIGRLTQLKELNLTATKTTSLPESIGQLAQLQILYLSGTKITILPSTLQQLTNLRALYLHNNQNLGIPVEILGPTHEDVILKNAKPTPPNEILHYYFRRSRPLNEGKLILVGRGNAGKTSLVNRLVHGTFGDEQKTDGIEITPWSLPLPGKETVQLNIWDFGGQEIMHATHQFFLTERSLYLLVLTGRDGLEDSDADYWLKMIENFGGGSPVIVVLNKQEEHPFSVNESGLRSKFPNCRLEFVRTDCATELGIAELREAIERETDRLPHLRDKFPASWFAIKNHLQTMSKHYLRFQEYQGECQRLGEEDKEQQKLLAGYLHRLGIALNYCEDQRLKDTHVLNPHWVTNGIYQILNAPLLERQKGEIQWGDLPQILDEQEYPRDMLDFLIHLMKKFDLCFRFVDDEDRYLIPELLDKQQPPEAEAFNRAQCLNFEYRYPVMPEGLLPRFIVRTRHLTENNLRWRTGTILQFEGCRALVSADLPDKRVFISITGPIPNRRRLLAVIRSQFEAIHAPFRHLDVTAMVPVPGHPNLVLPYNNLCTREAAGRLEFSEVIGDDLIDLNVLELLNGVDLEGERRNRKDAMTNSTKPISVLFSYSHKNEVLRKELETHLSILQRRGIIQGWHDRNIEAGTEWEKQISQHLEDSQIILLLVSANFIDSDYCWSIEMTRALERHEAGTARVIPVIVEDCNWQGAPFGKLQALPKDGKAVELWEVKNSAWRDISEGIERAAKALQKAV